MASVNRVTLVGNLGRDPETRYTPGGTAITNASLATSHSWKDKTSGEKKEETTWHTIVFTERLAEVAAEYLKKGSQVYIEGRISVRKWQDKSGQDRYTTEIVASEMQMLGSRQGPPAEPPPSEQNREPATTATATAAEPAKKKDYFGDMEDDIPF